MFVVIYRWKLKDGKESDFKDAWRRATEAIYRRRGSLGSQLMKAGDGTYYAIARWPDRDLWLNRSQPEAADPEASKTMGELTEAAYPPIELEVSEDMLQLQPCL